jgi:hypothetical protein
MSQEGQALVHQRFTSILRISVAHNRRLRFCPVGNVVQHLSARSEPAHRVEEVLHRGIEIRARRLRVSVPEDRLDVVQGPARLQHPAACFVAEIVEVQRGDAR